MINSTCIIHTPGGHRYYRDDDRTVRLTDDSRVLYHVVDVTGVIRMGRDGSSFIIPLVDGSTPADAQEAAAVAKEFGMAILIGGLTFRPCDGLP